MTKNIIFPAILIAALWACNTVPKKQAADLLVFAEAIHLGEGQVAEAMAVVNGKVVFTGTEQEVNSAYQAKQSKVFSGMHIYPGFNDAHAHFLGYSESLGRVNLVGTNSWQEVLDRLVAFAEANPADFIAGRGWDQNDWELKTFPTKVSLDSLFPSIPVVLARIDGHAVIANQAALNFAEIDAETEIVGGAIYSDENGLTGLLVDNAVGLIEIPSLARSTQKELIFKAQQNCLRTGITSITDAGLKKDQIELLKELYEKDSLKIRMNIMVSDDSASLAYYLNRKPMEEPGFRVKTVKFYLDGALGSRGALLLDDYADDPGNRGLQLKPLSYFETMADSLSHVGWQMAIHAIGDSANRLAASIFSIGYAHNTDHRWRVEHAQIVHPEDQQRFKDLNIIPSIQPTHSTSDMYWADKRLGTARSTYAYPAKSFRDLGLETPLGTDFPVEDINPFYTLRAAMYRQDAKGYPADGFRPEEALSFKEALKGMTWSGAYASFEEDVKGLLKPGYYADFIVLKEDLSKVSAEEMGDVKVLATAINGEFLMAL